MTALLTGTASLAALCALRFGRRDRAALLNLARFSSFAFLAVLFRPDLWTPETFVASEGVASILAVFVGLGAARRARTRPDVMFSALCLALVAGVAGHVALTHVPLVRNFAYRGVAFVDLAVVAVLATVAQRSAIVDRLDGIALRWLSACFALSALRLLMFEFHFGLGRFLGWLQAFAWLACMLLVAREAISPRAPSR